ncbi:MAG: glycerophosphodiester phosphodiesterase [Actinomycetota bacterium]|jgi:glycerophosphoryl diester phosphodiesterase|nr:glycerophosphodiester phosphodiesterase [Actinomycetota bacterium]
MSNFVIKQEGPASVTAEKIWQVRLGAFSFVLGALAGVLAGVILGSRASGGNRNTPLKDWPINLAHRGGAGIAPENTLEAFREALRVGAGGLELDIHATADGRLVVIHDETVDRTTDGSGAVGEMTLAEVKRLDAGYWFTTDGGRSYPWRQRGVRVPTLEEVHEHFEGVPINVEIKEPARPGVEEALFEAIRAAGTEDRTLVVSENTAAIRRFRKASGGRVATGSSTAEIVVFDVLRRVRLSSLLRPPYRALQGPENFRGLLRVVTPGFVRASHEIGVRVDVWTINDEPSMRRLLGFGVDGIMTDRPDILAKVLRGE